MDTMLLFLDELAELLKKHNVTIIRSANSTHDLVVSMQKAPDEFKELTFPEDISEMGIRQEWYC